MCLKTAFRFRDDPETISSLAKMELKPMTFDEGVSAARAMGAAGYIEDMAWKPAVSASCAAFVNIANAREPNLSVCACARVNSTIGLVFRVWGSCMYITAFALSLSLCVCVCVCVCDCVCLCMYVCV